MNLTDRHIHHPRLGQLPTGGNRFDAILIACARLRGIQERAAADSCQAASDARRAYFAALGLGK